MLKRIILLIVTLLIINGCDYMPSLDEVVPDRRNEYRKSEALPDLEVPPDLTTEALNDPLAIPNEEATTLSEFQRRKGARQSGAGVAGAGVDPLAGEQWLTLQGTAAEIWPKLGEFWVTRGYTLDLNDAELGVMETGWLESVNQGISAFRDKFSIISESGGSGTTIIYISSQRQEKLVSETEETEWVDIEKNPDFEKQAVSDLNLYFYGTNAPVGTSSLTAAPATTPAVAAATAAVANKPKAEMLDLGEDKIYLSLPDEFTKAWTMAEAAILKAGLFIENNDRAKGLYYILYYEPKGEEGMFSKLKFWGDDEPEGEEYQLSLTGVGDKTEMVVLNNKGDWVSKEEATKILTYIQVHYNNALR